MKTIYALIWRCPDETFSQDEFNTRIPRLMEWLRTLHASGNLLGCGGGGFETATGGLTLIQADSIEHATELASGTPMNEIGTTEVFIWDVFYANLVHQDNLSKLQ